MHRGEDNDRTSSGHDVANDSSKDHHDSPEDTSQQDNDHTTDKSPEKTADHDLSDPIDKTAASDGPPAADTSKAKLSPSDMANMSTDHIDEVKTRVLEASARLATMYRNLAATAATDTERQKYLDQLAEVERDRDECLITLANLTRRLE